MQASNSLRIFTSAILLGCLSWTCGCRSKPKEEEEEKTYQEQVKADREAAISFLKANGDVDWRKRVNAAAEALDQAKSDRRWGRSEQALQQALKAAQLLPPQSKDFEAAMSSAGSSGEEENEGESSDGSQSSGSSSGQSGGGSGGSGSNGASGGGRGSGATGGGNSAGGGGNSNGGSGNSVGGTGNSAGGGGNSLGGTGNSVGGTGNSAGGAGNSAGGAGLAASVFDGDSVSNAEVQQLRETLQELLESLDEKSGRRKSELNFETDAIEIR